MTKALEIDDQLAEARSSLANITWLYEWDWPAAEREFKRATELQPNYPTAHQWYSAYLSAMGRHDEAITEAKRAYDLDSLSVPIIRDLARAYYHARQYDQAIATYKKVLELDQHAMRFPVIPYNMARAHALLGERNRALDWLEKAFLEHSDHLVLLKVDPIFDPLRGEPRFAALLRRVGFES